MSGLGSSWITNPYVTWGIAIVLGVLSSLIANFLSPKLILLLEGGKTVSRVNRQRQAKRLNKIINDLHSGKKDKSNFFARVYSGYAVMIITVVLAITDTFVILALAPVNETSPSPPTVTTKFFLILLYFLAAFSFILSQLLIKRIEFVADSVANFGAYTTSYEKEWGTSSPP
jgi:hypothetical protein